MKLLILIGSLARGGAERVTANLANQLVDEGWSVTIVTLADASVDCYELRPAVRRIALRLEGESGNPFVAVVNNFRRISAVRRALRAERPDAALGMMNTASVLIELAARGLGIVTLGTERGNPSTVRLSKVWTWLRRMAFGRLDAVIALTPEAATWLAEHAGARNIAVIPNAVMWPLPDQAPKKDPGSVGKPGRNRLMAVGRLTRVKGYDKLLTAFAAIAARHPDWELVIVGEGPERGRLQSQVEQAGISQQVVLAGEVGNLAEWYRHAHLFVLTSRHEGFPNVLLEAMSHGLPSISFDCEAGPRNIIRQGVDGVLVQDQDAGALASALDQLMGDRESRARYGALASEVRERFALTHILGLWRDLITEKVRLNGRINIGQGVSRPV